jgi:hypothetical protein
MSRKHFIQLANALKATRPLDADTESAKLQWNFDAVKIAGVCSWNNPRFRFRSFYEACGGLFYGIGAVPLTEQAA